MLRSLVKNLVGTRPAAAPVEKPAPPAPLRLHIGGQTPHPDWKILDIEPREHTDYVGSCTDLSQFAGGSVLEIYASHVLEHLSYQRDLATALREFHRVLTPGGLLRASVPDLATLCALFVDPALNADERFYVMRVIYGGQTDDSDFHYVGLTDEILLGYLTSAGFTGVKRVDDLGLFDDTSRLVFKGRPISLNVLARKPAQDAAASGEPTA